MRHTATRFIAGPTLNYTKSSPFIPPPPALPRFESAALDELESEEDFDELDVAETTQRPILDPVRAGRFARAIRPQSEPSIVVDATSEVALEDILLEAYVEVPPPPTRRSQHLVTAPPSPSPAQAQAVDALLRASEPAFAPYGSFAPPPPPYQQPYQPPYVGPGFASYEDSPSVAPVAFSSTPSHAFMIQGPIGPTTAAGHYAMNAPTVAPPKSRAGAILGWGAALLVLSAGTAAVVTVGLKTGAFARLRTSSAVSAKTETTSVAAAPKPVPRSVPITAPPSPSPVPAVSIDSLPKPAIGESMTLVTFPASAQGHRVFFDGKPYAVTPEPLMLRCGRHNIRIGSAGKVRVTDLTCGREQTLTR